VGQTTCGDTFGALTASNLQKAISSGSLNIGEVDLTRVGSGNDDELVGYFATYPLNSLIRSYAGSYGPSLGSCLAYELAYGTPLVLTDPIVPTLTFLDAGSSLTVTPSNGKPLTAAATSTGQFGTVAGTPSSPYIIPGVYAVTNGNGGSQVPAFNWSDLLSPPIPTIGLPTTVNRAQNLTVNWTDTGSFTVLSIFGYSAVPLNSTTNSWVQFVCTTSASAGSFTIPSAILSLLPTNGYGATGELGVDLQIAGIVDNRFTVTGTPGLDAGLFTIFSSYGVVAKVQ
jgi:hypothetical protein